MGKSLDFINSLSAYTILPFNCWEYLSQQSLFANWNGNRC